MRRSMILVAALTVALVAGTAVAKQNGKNRVTSNFNGALVSVAGDSVSVDVTGGDRRAGGSRRLRAGAPG